MPVDVSHDALETDNEGEPDADPSLLGQALPAEIASVLQDTRLDALLGGDLFGGAASWARLSEAERGRLLELLPAAPTSDDHVTARAARDAVAAEVLGGTPLFFGSPLSRFWDAMQRGELTAEALAEVSAADARAARHRTETLRESHNATVHRLHHLKRTWNPPVPVPPPRARGGPGGGAQGLIYSKQSGGLVRRNAKGGVGVPLGRPCLNSMGSMGGAAPSEAAGGGGGRGGAKSGGRASTSPQPGVARGAAAPSPPGRTADVEMGDAGVGDGVYAPSDEDVDGLRGAPSPPGAAGFGGDAFGVPEGFPHELCFFRLVRDAVSSVPQELAPAEYVSKQVAIQAESAGLLSKLPRGTGSMTQYIRSVIHFMSTPAACHAAKTVRSAEPSAPPPPALIEFDAPTQSYRWVADAAASRTDALQRLEAMHCEPSAPRPILRTAHPTQSPPPTPPPPLPTPPPPAPRR